MIGFGDSQRVAELIRETAEAELIPRFRNLSKSDVREKEPGDFVTVADMAAEKRLTAGLSRILPGVPVVGEEAVEADPRLVDLIGRRGESCWIVDPLDGTNNFAEGKDTFAIIVCLVHDAQTVAGWILDAPNRRMAVARKGEGVSIDGFRARLEVTDAPPDGLVGYKFHNEFDRHLPPEQRSRLGRMSTLRCAGVQYLDMLSGKAGFCLFRTTKPWDHAAGVLMLTEAGGGAVNFAGEPYSPGQSTDAGIIGASSTAVLSTVRELFSALRPLASKA